jgi:hypothetical protein
MDVQDQDPLKVPFPGNIVIGNRRWVLMVGIEVYMKTKLPLALDSEMQALARHAEAAADHSDIVRIVAFGSRVRGDFHGASDLDKKDLAAYRLEKADVFLNDAKRFVSEVIRESRSILEEK